MRKSSIVRKIFVYVMVCMLAVSVIPICGVKAVSEYKPSSYGSVIPKEIYNDNGIVVKVTGSGVDNWGDYRILFTFENNTNKNLTMFVWDTSVDGITLPNYMVGCACKAKSGTIAYGDIDISEKNLDKLGITEFKTMEFTVDFSDENYNKYAKSPVTLDFKPHAHAFDSGEVTIIPTCEKEGEKTYKCTCGETKKEVIPASGHTFGEWKITKEATVSEEGEKKRVCSSCGYAETEVIEKKEAISIESADVSIPDQVYTGNRIKPNMTVTVDGSVLKAGTDYSTDYKDNVNVGTATVTIKGKGDYIGTVTKTFTISQAVINDTNTLVNLTGDNPKYTGEELKPGIMISTKGMSLIENVNYKVEYENNINAGTATVIITGIGNCTGTVKKEFSIEKADNSLQLTVSSAKFKSKALKSKKSIKIGAEAEGGVIKYQLSSKAKKAKLKVSPTGKITIPKKCKKGKYKITVKVPESENYLGVSKVVTIKVK